MKRYQVFISSTYNDLRDERRAVLETILKLRHIPVGMEQFVAANDEQFNYIKNLIDDTDYYILILGNRYGTPASDGISYTEKEFDYAVSRDIPILAFVHSMPESLPENRAEKTAFAKKRLEKFRDKVKTNRLVSLFSWDSPAALSREVVVALTNAIADYPRPGWERVSSYDYAELLSQLNDLRIENNNLKQKIELIEGQSVLQSKITSFPWNQKHCFIGRSVCAGYQGTQIPVELSWLQLFSVFGPAVFMNNSTTLVHYSLNKAFFGDRDPDFRFSDSDYQKMVLSFLKSGAISLNGQEISLTNAGEQFLSSNSIPMDAFLEKTIALVQTKKPNLSSDGQEFQDYIKRLSSFSSNPDSICYIGGTLVKLSVFLSEQQFLSDDDVEHAQKLIKEVLENATENPDCVNGAIPVFNLSKILEIIQILQTGFEEAQ